MTNAEVIKALRNCFDGMCSLCPYDDLGLWTKGCEAKLMLDAADALEAQQTALDECAKQLADMAKRIAELEAQEPTEKQVVDYCRKRCLDCHGTFSLLPKEGEWIEVHDWLHIPQEERGTYRCSACGQVMKYPWNYCPNCGAKMNMKKGKQE